MLKTCQNGHRYEPLTEDNRGGCYVCHLAKGAQYRKSQGGKETQSRYNTSPKGNLRKQAYEDSQKGRLRRAQYNTFYNIRKAIEREERWLNDRIQEQVRD